MLFAVKKVFYVFCIMVMISAIPDVYAEDNYNYPSPEIQYNMNKVISDMKSLNEKYANEGPTKVPQLIYLFSDSVPDVTMKNVFKAAKKISSIEFTGCLQGFIGEDSGDLRKFIEKQVGKGEIDNIEVRLDPFFFRDLEVAQVPALVYAKCSTTPTQCDYEMIIYGDSSLDYLISQMSSHAISKEDKVLLSKVAYEIRHQ